MFLFLFNFIQHNTFEWIGLGQYHIFGSFFLHLQNFFYTSKISLNSQKTLWSFKETRRHHTPRIMSTFRSQNIWLPEVKIYHRKSNFRSQNISSEVNFRKSKCITGSRLSEVKNYHQKSTPENQKIFPEVDFRKSKNIFRKLTSISESKNIPGSQLLKIKKYSRKSTSESQKTFSGSWLP